MGRAADPEGCTLAAPAGQWVFHHVRALEAVPMIRVGRADFREHSLPGRP